jgi:hemoglobin/transferrin/lactoferrin receptor protein
MNTGHRYTCGASAIALAVGMSIAAHPAAGSEVANDGLETVTIVARVPRPLAATDASVTIIDTLRIEQRLARDLRDLARYEPGLSVRGDATRFGDESISIRGIGGNRVRLETDGVPRPSAFAVGSFANAGRSLAELDFVRRIEILKGPASATYGSAAIGGIVAVETLDPVDLLGDERRWAARARLQYSSDDHGTMGSSLLAGRSGPVEWLAGYRRRDASELQNNWTTLDANPRDARDDSWLAKAVLTRGTAPLRLTVAGAERRALTDVNSLLLQPGRFANTIAMRGNDRADERSIAIDQRLLDIWHFAQIEWRLYHQRVDVEQRTFEERRAAPPRTPALRLQRSFQYEARVSGGKLIAAIDGASGDWSHRISFGADLSRQHVDELRDGLQTTLPSLATTTTILGEAFPLRDFPRSRIDEAGLFIFDEIRRGESRLSLSPALRLDHYRLTPAPDVIYLADNPTQTPVAIRETSVSPRLGFAWRFDQDLAGFGQYTHGFRSPPFEDVNIGLDLPQFLTRAIPNPDLRPERSDHFEVGLRAAAPHLSGTASVFLARYRDFIESKVNLGRDPVSGYTIFQSQNRARARIWGAEVALRTTFGAATSEDPPWSATVAAGWARGDDTARNRPLNSVDPARATLGLEYRDRSRGLGVEALLNLVATQDRVDESSGPLARAAGHVTLDLIGSWRMTDGLRLRAAVFNVFDRRHVEWADIRGRAATDPALDLYTRPGRSVTLGVTLQLD